MIPATPAMVVLRWFLLASWVWFAVPWLWAVIRADGATCYRLTPNDVQAELRGVRARLLAGDDEKMHHLFPEGRLFSHSFYGFTLVNVALSNPQDQEFRIYARTEVQRELLAVENLATKAPFEECQKLTPRGGVIPAGHANLLRAGYLLLGGDAEAIVAAFHARSQELYDAFAASPVANLETYPGERWPVDNVMAIESLRLHDVLYGTQYQKAAANWADWMAAHLDDKTGLLNSQVGPKGGILDGPRGCALSWTLSVLPNFAPELAEKQYAIYRSTWFVHPLGTTGIREFPTGTKATFMDSDTGPIIFSMGTAATGFGIAAAKANHDEENLTGLLRALELTSFPIHSMEGSHQRFFGQVVLADVLAIWGKTLCRWDAPTAFPPPAPPAGLKSFWIVAVTLTLVVGLVTALLLRGAWRAGHSWRASKMGVQGRTRWFLGVTIAALLAFLLFSSFGWVYAFIIMALVEMVERRLLTCKNGNLEIAEIGVNSSEKR